MADHTVNLGQYLAPLLRRWWLLLAAVLLATGSSYFATRQEPAIYQARATLMVGRWISNPNPAGPDVYLTQQLAGAYADFANREPVQNAVMDALGLRQLPSYNVRSVPNTQLIELAVTDTDPRRAQAVANELANQIIRLGPAGSESDQQPRQAFIEQQLDELEAGIKQTKDEISKKESELAGLFSARQIADAQAQIAALRAKLTGMQNNYGVLLQSSQRGAINTLSFLEKASLPTTPIGPNTIATMLLAAAMGLGLAILAAYLLEYIDDTLKNPDDVQKILQLVTLGAIPLTRRPITEAGLLTESTPEANEAYSVLRTNLQFTAVGQTLGSLLITSPGMSEGKSLTAARLGIALAQAEQRVILVDCDLRRPHLHHLFGLSNTVGLTGTLLQHQHSLDKVLQETSVPGLRVLTSGPLPPNPSALLGSARMRGLLEALQTQADIILLDSPPATAFADTAILSTLANGVLLVINVGTTRRGMARRAVEGLTQVNAKIIGVLLNRMPRRSNEYYYHYEYHQQPRGLGARKRGRAREKMGATTMDRDAS